MNSNRTKVTGEIYTKVKRFLASGKRTAAEASEKFGVSVRTCQRIKASSSFKDYKESAKDRPSKPSKPVSEIDDDLRNDMAEEEILTNDVWVACQRYCANYGRKDLKMLLKDCIKFIR